MNITPSNARLTTDWFGSGGGTYSGCLMLNGLDVAHVTLEETVSGSCKVSVNVVQPGDGDTATSYAPINIDTTPWDDMAEPVLIDHTFTLGGGGDDFTPSYSNADGLIAWLTHIVGFAAVDPGTEEWLPAAVDGASGAVKVDITGTEKFLRFVAAILDIDDDGQAHLDRTVTVAKVQAMPEGPERNRRIYELQGWLTVGQLRQATENLREDTPVAFFDGAFFRHATLEQGAELTAELGNPLVIGRSSDSFKPEHRPAA